MTSDQTGIYALDQLQLILAVAYLVTMPWMLVFFVRLLRKINS